MRKSAIGLIVVGAAASLALAACSSDKNDDNSAPAGGSSTSASSSASASSGSGGALDGKGAKVGIILPDTQSSQRWVTSDPNAMAAECKKVNLDCDIQNAQNDAGKMKTIAESMANNGVKVLMITNLDSASGAAIQQEAQSKGITTIDYDRLTLGGKAALYISYDNVAVGTAQGNALVKCPQVAGKSSVTYVDVNGAPTDNNATLFKQGYDGVLSKQPGWKKADDQSIAKWDNAVAGTTFTAMLRKTPGINAVMVANDGMANSVIAALKNQKLNGKVAVSGQDATAQGLQNIMSGDQCFSIYKPSAQEAVPAIDAIAQIVNGQTPTTTGTIKDTQTGQDVPAILATPIAITKENVAQPINDGYTPKDQVCTGNFAALCSQNGVK
ncbi:sugar ABC transporter substrate-binding protein [Jatrophihabitans sp.]|uniref:sugar ABC transporter substrate-binding protein n=1 Tax=Jatrophihabitans sp. TaxID=1932789 RepID=UPI002CB29841|nr:substrate-binding domain-containing protein [Jatrophihabitans sp.]